jgi:serine/threonine-protein kinase
VPPDDDLLNEIADAILDGTPIDWSDATARAAGGDGRLLDRLKILNELARLHRELTGDAPDPPGPRASGEPGDDDPHHLGRWGHLTLLEFVGRGAFGEVYRAREARLDRDVALKLLPLDATEARASSIIEEGRLAARVRHPNVVTIHGAERRGGQVGLWMEFIRGRTLEQMLRHGKRFTVTETVAIGIQLCDAASAVHAAGLLHRDIKSQNVMLEDGGRAVLMDFGAGREVGDPTAAALAGTPLYLAPELLSGSDPSVQSDVYSVGVVLYHLLTDSYPVRADVLHELRDAHRRGERADLRTARPDVPPRLARIIDRALKPKPEDRYPTARSLAAELTALRHRQPRVSVPLAVAVAAALVLLAWLSSLARIAWNGERPAMSAAASLTAPGVRSIAVLPFKPVAAALADERLQHAMTEAMIDRLSRLRTVRVEPLTRVRAYGAANQDPVEAGRALGVDAVLQGNVQQAGSGVQVRVQLLRTADGVALIGDRQDQAFRSALEAQSQLIQTLAEALELAPAERSRLGRQETSSAEAFRHYSFGQYHLEQFNVEHMRQAEREFREAIRLDPQYARAHAALGLTLVNMVWLQARRPLEIRDSAEASALKAIALDESVAVAHTVLALTYQYFDYAPFKAQREHLRAMELDDQDISVLRAYSFFLLHHDAFDEALDVHRRTLEFDPASPLSTRQTAEMLLVARRYDECVIECRRAKTLEPDDAKLLVSHLLGRCLEQQGRRQEAIEAYRNSLTERGEGALAEQLKRAYARDGWLGYWRERLRTAPPHANLAGLHVRLGNIDEAMLELQRAERTRSLSGWMNIPEFDPLRADPRFQALRARTGFSDEVNARLAAARLAARSSAQR